MLYHNVRVAAHLLRFIDSTAIAAASAAAWVLGVESGAWPESTIEAMAVYVVVSFFTFVALGGRLRVYQVRRTENVAFELIVLCEVALYASGLACMTTQIFTSGMPGYAYLAAVTGSLLALLFLRLAMRLLIRRLRRRGDDYRVWLIVGHNERSADLAVDIVGNPHFGIRIEEIVDFPDVSGATIPQCARLKSGDLSSVKRRVLSGVDDVRDILATRVIDEVVITLAMGHRYDAISRIIDFCSAAGISVKLRAEAFENVSYSTDVSYVGNIPMVTHYSGPSNYSHLLVKRLIDVLGAAVGVVLLSPAFLVIALAVKLGSPGPLFFRQTRVGLHGRHFEMIKFRSMVREAPLMREHLEHFNERDEIAFKIRNDARITPVGRVLRKYHLDELPQLWNVLVGDMSLVGPRPLPVKEAQGSEWWQRRRLTMPPGLTCFWQLADDQNMPFREWMRLDMAYIDKWSLWLDFKLIVRTFGALVRGSGW